MHTHAMHRTNTTLVGSEYTDVHRGSSRFGSVVDSDTAVEPPWRDARFIFSYLHQDQAKAPAGTPTTSGGCSSSAISGRAPAELPSIRTSGAGVFGNPWPTATPTTIVWCRSYYSAPTLPKYSILYAGPITPPECPHWTPRRRHHSFRTA